MVRYDPCTDSFIDNPTKEITATINLNAIPKDIIQINEAVEVSDESIEKIADAVVRKLTDRKTENCSEKPNNCETQTDIHGITDCDFCKHGSEEWDSEACDGCCNANNHFEPKDEPRQEIFVCPIQNDYEALIEYEPQTERSE